jgi:O-succinylbenzoic acid--CoA ligase
MDDRADFLAEAAARWPQRRALSAPGRSWSFGALDAWVGELAARIHAEDRPDRDDVLAPVVQPTPEGVAALLAATRAGLTVAPLNPALTPAEHEAALRGLTGARPDGMAVLWTSGTSGTPRGVVLGADNLRASALASQRRLALTEHDRWLASLSMAHVGGLALVTRALILGSEIVAYGAFDAGRASALIDEGQVTHASLVPTQLHRILDARAGRPAPATFCCALIGGAHAPPDLVERALGEGWPIALTYGMTEMTSQVATAPPDLVRRKPGTVGAPLDGVEVRIAEDGEVLARGRMLARGLVGPVHALADAAGWYRTGDLGRLDEEGHLWITGRCCDRIVSGGVTIDPREVETVLRAHPAVVDACVVGLVDVEWGEKVAAAVVPVEGAFDLEDVDAWSRAHLGPPRRPRRWLLLDALPLNANGKVDREAVRRSFKEPLQT